MQIEDLINHVEQLKCNEPKDISYLAAFESESIDLEIVIEDLIEASKFLVLEIPALDKDNYKYLRQLDIYSDSLLGVFSMDFSEGLLAIFSKTQQTSDIVFLKQQGFYGEMFSVLDDFNKATKLTLISDEDDL